MKSLLTLLLIILVVFTVVALGGGLLVLMAYGVGWLLNHIIGVDSFQATLLALLGICVFGFVAERIWETFTSMPSFDPDDFDFDGEDDEDENEEDDPFFVNPRIPRWRQPLRNVDFSNARPDDRCPCGSGRKYKNCHGAKQPK
jgi:hypothetical protein